MMKLLSYHIENYGKLKNQDGVFSENLLCVCEENGFGKSTLASFIKGMFYGLPSYTSASKTFNDRQRYYPFEGGKFGGNLTFESGGAVYKIERFFDKKSAKGDECKVYKNGVPFDGFGEEIGKTLFGLDEESFKKTVFITADEIEISSTHSINEKLNRTVESTEEDGFEKALDLLDRAKKSLKAGRGNNDKISKKKAEIAELNDAIQNYKDMSAGLAENYAERERLNLEISTLEKEWKKANERELVLQKWERFDSTCQQKEVKQAGVNRLKEKYPLGLPSEEERKLLIEKFQQNARLRGSLQSTAMGIGKEERLQALREKFANDVPMYETMEENQRKINRILSAEMEMEKLSSVVKTEREKKLQAKFSVSMPSEDELKEKQNLVDEWKRRDTEYKTLSDSLLQTAQTKYEGAPWIWFALGAILCGVGISLLFLVLGLGIALIACGVLSLIVGMVAWSKGTKTSQPTPSVQLHMVVLQSEMKLLEEKIRNLTVAYGYYGELGAAYDFAALIEDLKEYQACRLALENRERELEKLVSERVALRREVSSFLQSYEESAENLQNGLNRLASAIASYEELKADKTHTDAREKEIKESLLKNEACVLGILEKYRLSALHGTMDGLNGLEVDAKELIRLEKEVAELEKELVQYKEKHGLQTRPTEEGNAEELQDRLSVLRKKLSDCDKQISEVERFVEGLPDAENALALAEETLKAYKEKHALIVDTMAALECAEQSLKDKYVAPIKERFSIYAQALEKVLDEKISMDKDFRIVFERGGESRSEKHLSAGERSLCALCLRLALIDNMYEDETPFIVMDDPFVHLDAGHMQRMSALIKELAKDKQILYFCCHESRSV